MKLLNKNQFLRQLLVKKLSPVPDLFTQNEKGELSEPWVIRELEEIKPVWETRSADKLCDSP